MGVSVNERGELEAEGGRKALLLLPTRDFLPASSFLNTEEWVIVNILISRCFWNA